MMAKRPVFKTSVYFPFYNEEMTEFEYYGGFAEIQKLRSINSLHQAYLKAHPQEKLLEISTKSPDALGVSLSAFSLHATAPTGTDCTLESLFQGSKVFECGGPYIDLYQCPPWIAKKDPRLRESGRIIAFRLGELEFPIEPKTFFYDWIYINALNKHKDLSKDITKFDGFTDIEFNPTKSLNCQARSAAIFASLSRVGLLEQALDSPEGFRAIVYFGDIHKSEFEGSVEEQLSFF